MRGEEASKTISQEGLLIFLFFQLPALDSEIHLKYKIKKKIVSLIHKTEKWNHEENIKS